MKIRRIALCLLMIILISFAAALSVKVAIGVGAWDGIPVLLNQSLGVKVGTLGMIANLSCVLLQFLLLRKAFGLRHILQIALSFILGYTVNFFLYSILGPLVFTSYVSRLLLFILATILGAFVVASVMLLDVVTFPLEGACMALAKKKKDWQFHKIRQTVDIICILIGVSAALLFDLSLVIREGTIVGMLIFSPVLGFFMKKLTPLYRKYDLTDAL